ncbi:J domain-containing protein [Novosphingobium lentum]|uniref:J domain-containing protein n=1 Tax=Novosphingobium lentum TaxID=145287 RepID=UPI00082B35FE|nr:molecular chaperone DnaJ [Novosphingobium lentum]
MIKLVELVILVSVACRLLSGQWPWELMKGADRSAAEARARMLLGLRSGASREDIIDAHRELIARVHPDRGGSSDAVHEANAARDVLLGGLARQRGNRIK